MDVSMDPAYERIIEPSGLVYTGAAYVLHGGFATLQALLVIYLVSTGIRRFLRNREDRRSAAIRMGSGVLIALPALTGAPFLVSLAGLGVGWVQVARQDSPWLRHGFAAAVVFIASFALFELEDPAALGVELASTVQTLRAGHMEWQQDADRRAPKVGDLAPDFSLEDPTGVSRARLSDFRGQRPVALLFGSYT